MVRGARFWSARPARGSPGTSGTLTTRTGRAGIRRYQLVTDRLPARQGPRGHVSGLSLSHATLYGYGACAKIELATLQGCRELLGGARAALRGRAACAQ